MTMIGLLSIAMMGGVIVGVFALLCDLLRLVKGGANRSRSAGSAKLAADIAFCVVIVILSLTPHNVMSLIAVFFVLAVATHSYIECNKRRYFRYIRQSRALLDVGFLLFFVGGVCFFQMNKSPLIASVLVGTTLCLCVSYAYITFKNRVLYRKYTTMCKVLVDVLLILSVIMGCVHLFRAASIS